MLLQKLSIALFAVFLLAGCGQKGALYLPKKEDKQPPAQEQPKKDEIKKDTPQSQNKS